MVVNRKVTGTAMSMPAGVGVGVLAALVVTLGGAALVAWFVGSEKLEASAIGYGAMVTLVAASFLGAWLAARKVKRRWLVTAVITGAAYFLLLLSATALFFGGQYAGIGMTALAVLGGSGAAALLGLRGEKRDPRLRRKYANG